MTSLTLLETYASPLAFLDASDAEIISTIQNTARFGLSYATTKCHAIKTAAKDALVFGHSISSNFTRIRRYIKLIRQYDLLITEVLDDMHKLVAQQKGSGFAEQIHLLESYHGAGFLSAVGLITEIGDFSALDFPKKLYLGLDPSVKQFGKWGDSKIAVSKRGTPIARRILHMMALQVIRKKRNGSVKNPVLREYYLSMCQNKPKKVANGAVIHKICNIVFAILRDKIIYGLSHQKNIGITI